MRLSGFAAAIAALQLLTAPSTVCASPRSCRASSVKSCVQAIQSTKTRSLSLTSWCSSVLGCVKSTKTISGDPVTITSTKIVTETYTSEYIVTETTETSSFDYTETTYLDVATETLTPIWTVERFVVKTVAPAPRRRDVDGLDAKDIFGREARTTSICHSTVQPKACKCLITSCTPVATKDLRKTIKEKTTDTTWVIIEQGITYTNTEWIPSLTTETQSYTWIEVSGILSTHSTTIKCTPSASPTNPSFYLQATSYPPPRPAASTMPINGQYYWAAALSPRLLSFSIEAAFTPDILEASVFSLDSKKRLHTAHKNGTQYANVDHYSHFPIAHLMGRGEITRRSYEYLRCEPRPPSGRFPGGYQELYCLADGFWHRDTWNYCPLYKEYFNAPLVLGDEWSETAPDCFNVTFLIKPVCGG